MTQLYQSQLDRRGLMVSHVTVLLIQRVAEMKLCMFGQHHPDLTIQGVHFHSELFGSVWVD